MRPEKASIVEELQARLNASPFLLVADYTGLKVGQFSDLRGRLAGAGARCTVVKNTFLRRAAKEAGLPELADLRGQTAVIVGDKDVAAAAKILKSFIAEFQKPIMKVGIVDRAIITTEQIKQIADLPSREILLAQLLGVLQSPAATFVRLLNEPATALARVLNAKAQAEPSEPAAAETVEAKAAPEPAAEAATEAAPAAEPALAATPAEPAKAEGETVA